MQVVLEHNNSRISALRLVDHKLNHQMYKVSTLAPPWVKSTGVFNHVTFQQYARFSKDQVSLQRFVGSSRVQRQSQFPAHWIL